MGSLLVVIAVAAVVVVWVRATRVSRRRWLAQLNLPGLWTLDGGEASSLELRGDFAGGDYTSRTPNGRESGTWRIAGQALVLQPEGQAAVAFELRLFDVGKIGIDGPGRERQVYLKRPDNVVTLRARS